LPSQPLFVLYENGTILYWGKDTYKEVRIGKSEKDKMISSFSLSDTLFQENPIIDTSKSSGDFTSISDAPTYTLTLNFDTIRNITIYGNVNVKSNMRSAFFYKIHDFIVHYRNDKAIDWYPEKIELHATDYGNPVEPSIKWPANWPDLKSKSTKQINQEESVIYLDKKYFGDLLALLKSRKETQAFEINGRRVFISYQFPLPGIKGSN